MAVDLSHTHALPHNCVCEGLYAIGHGVNWKQINFVIQIDLDNEGRHD